MRLLIEWLWNYIHTLLYGKLFKKKGVKKVVRKSYGFTKEKAAKISINTRNAYMNAYRNTNASVPNHKTRVKNRHNRKRRHKK